MACPSQIPIPQAKILVKCPGLAFAQKMITLNFTFTYRILFGSEISELRVGLSLSCFFQNPPDQKDFGNLLKVGLPSYRLFSIGQYAINGTWDFSQEYDFSPI